MGGNPTLTLYILPAPPGPRACRYQRPDGPGSPVAVTPGVRPISRDLANVTMLRRLLPLLLAVVPLFLPACAGGSKSKSSGAGGSSTCGEQGSFCLVTCNLGCTLTGGCGITDIAQNQPLTFTFSRDVDPASVDFTTFSLKTINGEEPVGQFVVEGQTVTFVPDVRFVQGQTFFGFAPNLDYVLTIPGGASAASALLSTAGQRLQHDYTCQLRITRGVVDLDQSSPRATLVTPASTFNVPRGTQVVIEFSELVDFGPFSNVVAGSEPIQYRVRRSAPGAGGILVCDLLSRQFALSGAPRLTNDIVRGLTIATFTPQESLPSGSCFEVFVTSAVRDLSGRSAAPAVFRFTLVEEAAADLSKEFDFQTDELLDRERSGGTWAGGAGNFAVLGGDGRHGDFTPSDGTRVTDSHWIFNTDSQVITRKPTATIETDETVTDGRFYFANLVLPAGWILEFRGSNPARLHVRGDCRIEGRITASGTTPTLNFNVKAPPGHPGGAWAGGPGAAGGPGGGTGGRGSYGCDGTGNPNQPSFNNFNGYAGESVRLPAGHAHAASAPGTGGQGGLLFPTHGDQSALLFPAFGIINVDTAPGGGGGGFVTPGTASSAPLHGSVNGQPPPNPVYIGIGVPGGTSVPLTTLPGSFNSSEYFLDGGSGGGGSGSHPLFSQTSLTSDPFKYRSGVGGAGGGGAARVRVGGRFEMLAGSFFDAGGGNGPTILPGATAPVPSTAGGGSGGTALIQLASSLDFSGTIDVAGGTGGRYSAGIYRADSRGGDGGAGFLRVETPTTAPSLARIGTVNPPAGAQSVGVLRESDGRVGFQSKYVSTGAVFPPTYVRYVVEADVDGVPTTFSDDAALGVPAAAGTSPLIFLVQGADVSLTGELLPNALPGPWRTQAGPFQAGVGSLNSDSTVGFRWILLQDRTLSTNVVVRNVRVDYRI